ncbi:2-amino-4-hydroxy-6-hydroxymethyldihydropteridine diphosphokinase [Pectinatus frisingensis]|uniref:2-amino-4-hydroxy-6- hydroxymethyldihydropteridine diphosphokinase n=1 Tax=Pectinatus frisingensis TaxID=865 RepID=UPI0015F65764|nr:2-amino-4-hydroxy-6-hydroxymethyldihydropteridine diphosphokinase [Pectinatus frisingensis]
MDIITINDLSVYAFHGILPEENKLGQNFFITAQLVLSTREAGIKDDLSATVNYADVCHFINDYTKSHTVKLIETAAEQLAEQILLKFPLIKKIILSIRKPGAPIGLPLKEVAVTISRSWHEVFIAFGSNIGDRAAYIDHAVKALKLFPQIRLETISDLYESTPYGNVQQADFLNGVLGLQTLLSPYELLDTLHKIEQAAGRKRTLHWGPRTLDLDILLYDNIIMDDENLTIPHKDMLNRDFVMIPLNQIAPYKIHPVSNKAICELCNTFPQDDLHIIKE